MELKIKLVRHLKWKKNCMGIWDEYDSKISKIIRPDNKTVACIREVDKYLKST